MIDHRGSRVQRPDRLVSLAAGGRGREDPDLVVHIVIPEAYREALPPFSRPGSYTQEDGGWRYRLDKYWQVEGAMLGDAAADPLPTTSDDPAVVDQDGDGKPAMTLRVTGLVDGEIYVVQRGWTELTGGPESDDEIRGELAFEAEQNVVGSDPANLQDLASEASTDTAPCASRFRMRRVSDDADCDFVKDNVTTLFP